MAARGELRDNGVLVADEKEANTLYNKGAFGTPQSGGSVLLTLEEALYLVENNRLRVQDNDAGSLLRHASTREPAFEIRYIVYRDLRGRTFAVKRSREADYNVFDRSHIPGKHPSKYLVRCVSERDAFRAPEFVAEARRITELRKTLLIALVDEEGDLTYYEAKLPDVRANVPALPQGSGVAHLLDDRVVVLDRESARRLHDGSFHGRDVGIGLQLSLPEAVHLANAGRLEVRDATGTKRVNAADLRERARTIEPDYDMRETLYLALRNRGLVVKTGFKYGTHFRGYGGTPDEEHAPYLFHALRTDREVAWPEVSGFVRLAHGVRKRLFFASPEPDAEGKPGFALLELTRTRP